MSLPFDPDHEIKTSTDIFFPIIRNIIHSKNIFFPLTNTKTDLNLYLTKEAFDSYDFSTLSSNEDHIYNPVKINANNHLIYDVKKGENDNDAINYEQIIEIMPKIEFNDFGEVILDFENKPITNMRNLIFEPLSLVNRQFLNENYYKFNEIPEKPVNLNYTTQYHNENAPLTSFHFFDKNYWNILKNDKIFHQSIKMNPLIPTKVYSLGKFSCKYPVRYKHTYVKLIIFYKILGINPIYTSEVYINKNNFVVKISKPGYMNNNFKVSDTITFNEFNEKILISELEIDNENYTLPTFDIRKAYSANETIYNEYIQNKFGNNFHVYKANDNIYFTITLSDKGIKLLDQFMADKKNSNGEDCEVIDMEIEFSTIFSVYYFNTNFEL